MKILFSKTSNLRVSMTQLSSIELLHFSIPSRHGSMYVCEMDWNFRARSMVGIPASRYSPGLLRSSTKCHPMSPGTLQTHVSKIRKE